MACNFDDVIDVDYIDNERNETATPNSYYYSGDLEQLKLPWLSEPHFVPLVTLYSLTFVVGIAGNTLVIFAILGDRKNRSVTNTYLVSLAVADILFLAICGPYETIRYFLGHWTVGRALCKIFGFVEMLSAATSIINLTAISVERYIAIVLPIKARTLCTHGRTIKILLLVWLIAVVASSPMFYVMNIECTNFHNNVTEVTVVTCSELGLSDERRLNYTIYQLVAMFAAPTAVMTYCYLRVIYTLWISTKNIAHMTSAQNSRTRHRSWMKDNTSSSVSRRFKFAIRSKRGEDVSAARKKVIKMLVTIIVVFLLCWGPKLIFKLLLRLRLKFLYESKSSHTAKIVFDCLPYVQSSANPIIYSFMSRKFRYSIRNAFNGLICRRKLRKYRHRLATSRLTDVESDTSHATNGLVQTTYTNQSSYKTGSDKMYEESTFLT